MSELGDMFKIEVGIGIRARITPSTCVQRDWPHEGCEVQLAVGLWVGHLVVDLVVLRVILFFNLGRSDSYIKQFGMRIAVILDYIPRLTRVHSCYGISKQIYKPRSLGRDMACLELRIYSCPRRV